MKNYSETQWSRILKAVIILGIQNIEKEHCPVGTNMIFPKAIEDIIVKNEEELMVRSMEYQQKIKLKAKAESIEKKKT